MSFNLDKKVCDEYFDKQKSSPDVMIYISIFSLHKIYHYISDV